ncbi:MAG: amidase, partial [Thermoleophilaceae bacterium]
METDLLTKPAGELARLVKAGEVTARELTEASLERIEALDGDLNAFVHLDPDGALATADAIDPGDERPFAGVPIAVKDTAPVAGMPYRLGSDVFGDFVPAHDAFVVRRLREAGFVIVGKTNLPEFGILPVTEPRRFGPTRNPWDVERTPGGSSGGAA